MRSIQLSWRLIKREWRSGELRILGFALVIAVAATTCMSFFTERLSLSIQRQSAEVIGGDLVLRSSRPLPSEWLQQGRALGLETVASAEFGTVLVHRERILLVSVKAVTDNYPIRGKLRIAETRGGRPSEVRAAPSAGEVWVERRVLDRLDFAVGELVQIGEQQLRVTRILTFEPDRGGDFLNLAPRVLMSQADLAATGVIQPGSRVRYSFLFAGSQAEPMAEWLTPRLGPGQRLLKVDSARGGAARNLANAQDYLRLIALMAVVLATVAMVLATQRYSQRHYDVSAMLRCLGASQNRILMIYLGQLLMLAAGAGGIGIILGWLVQVSLVQLLSELLPAGLPKVAFLPPAATGLMTGVIILLGTALPPLLRIREVSPLRVMRRSLAPLPLSGWTVYFAAAVAIALVILLVVAFLVALLFLLVYLLLRVNPGRLLGRRSLLGRGMTALTRHARSSSGQVIAFAVTLMMMLVVVMLRTELMDNWRAQLPADAPNHFAFNIQPAEVSAFQELLVAQGIAAQPLYPMVRGRLTGLNGQPLQPKAVDRKQIDDALRRELNLTWAAELPADNRIVEGDWWPPESSSAAVVSVERELAERLGLALGDQLTFDISGQPLTAKITSLRTVQWESFSPNFYMIFPPGVLDAMPATYVTSFLWEAQGSAFLAEVVRQFPSVTVLEVEVILEQLRRILQQVTVTVEGMLLFVLLAGFTVLFAAVQLSLDQRLREGALLRALGARRDYLARNNLMEFALLGALSGLLAVLGAEAINAYLYTRLFDIVREPPLWPWLVTPLLASGLIAMAGQLATRRVVTQSPKLILQQYD